MTTTLPDRVDVAVIGAGTAGAAAAAHCAREGLRVLCLDRGPLDRAGARWVNGVPAWSFAAAGFDPPEGDELLGDGGPFHLIAGWGPRRLVIEHHGVLEVDMRALVERLQRRAREAGAILAGNCATRGVDNNVLSTDRGAVHADVVVDASGLAGLRLLDSPRVQPTHLCAAAQEVRTLADPAGARAFFERIEVPLGQVACFAGVAGGYSIVNVRCHGDRVSILTGSIPGDGHPSGKALLDRFVSDQPWIGEPLFGGARAIPIRRPMDVIAAGRVAAIGDAAAQVFPAHGSGIGVGMIAARVLAESIARGAGPEEYAVRWQRRWGGLMASYDLFRRFSQRLQPGELEAMMDSGLMDPDLARAGMAQELPRPTPAMIAGKTPALARRPRLAARLGAVALKMAAARALYSRYPTRPGRLPVWSRRIASVFGEPPDLPLRARA